MLNTETGHLNVLEIEEYMKKCRFKCRMSANVVHAKLAFEVKVSDFLATSSFYRNKTVLKMFLIIIKG